MQRLKQGRDFPLSIPLFDKAVDDRAPLSRWQTLVQPADIILFEGWCVGATAQSEAQLVEPINSLEREEDPQQVWRRYVNEQLAGPYQALFAMIDVLMMLKVPAMEKVFEWRLLQETKLKQSLADNAQTGTHVMSEQQLNRFIMHYERITRTCLEDMPGRADVVLQLNDQHQISEVQLNGD
jgi:D-glycerate 3-kinase